MLTESLTEAADSLDRLCVELLRTRKTTRGQLVGALLDLTLEYAEEADAADLRQAFRNQLLGLAADLHLHRADLASLLHTLANDQFRLARIVPSR